ncbi:MAG: pyruvate dehydrogenase (acetyl-transferring) E1 component subunit alpha [Planctomycetota bacterium]
MTTTVAKPSETNGRIGQTQSARRTFVFEPKGKRLTDDLPDDTLVSWLRDMMLIREFEIRTMAAYQQAKIGGFCHVYTGQEPVVVGTFAAIEHDDPIITAYRDHGHALARGMDPKACMAEMFGKITGCAKGKGGSMHMFDKPNHLYGGHGIVGAQTPLGLGLAFATRYQREVVGVSDKKHVTLCFLGDGALNQGALHEAMNLANLPQTRCPVIYIVENNAYSMGTSIERGTTMAHDLTKKADAYGIDSITIDGFDVRSVYDQFKPFADECRDEQKPGFVDLHCYRYQGHSMSDPQKYRTKDEVESAKERDGIDALAHHLMSERKCLDEEAYKAMQKELKAIVKDAVKFAEESAAPQPEDEMYSDVYVNPQPGLTTLGPYHEGAKNPLL